MNTRKRKTFLNRVTSNSCKKRVECISLFVYLVFISNKNSIDYLFTPFLYKASRVSPSPGNFGIIKFKINFYSSKTGLSLFLASFELPNEKEKRRIILSSAFSQKILNCFFDHLQNFRANSIL